MGNEGSKKGARNSSAGEGTAGKASTSTGVSSVFASSSTKTVTEHLRRAERSGVLQLAKCGLKEVPAQMLQMRTLRTIDLSSNKIDLVPSFVGQFTNLKQLNLAENRIRSLPDEIGNLKKCETLSLKQNQLTSIPNTIVGLFALKTLNLSQNQLSDFPLAICDLPNLEMLDLSMNKLETVAGPTERLKNLKAIELNLNQNRLQTLNDGLADCSRLKILRVQENCLSLDAFSPELLGKSNVSLLCVEGNLFQDKEFHQLDGYEAYQERYTDTKKKMY